MPELPEVEAARAHLATWTEGRRVVAAPAVPELAGRTLLAWHRRGKRLAGRLDDGRWLLAHLGLTGAFRRLDLAGLVSGSSGPPSGLPAPGSAAPPRHARFTLTLDDGLAVALVDPRGFGRVAISEAADPFSDLGPDALSLLAAPDAPDALADRLGPASPRAVLKDRALDQARLAGLGNIAILEGAFRARLHPHLPLAALDAAAFARLAAGLRAHLEETLADCLATPDLVYVSQGGPNPFAVYGRAGAPCPAGPSSGSAPGSSGPSSGSAPGSSGPSSGSAPGSSGPSSGSAPGSSGHPALVRTVRAGRPTFFCPACQPLPP
jgi:formamidopyrimidine-DNA glycosylase